MIPALIPGIIAAVPSIVKLAEGLFGGGKGPDKKQFVLEVLGKVYDFGLVKIIPDWEAVDERRLFLKLCDVLIEEVVLQLKK